MASACIQHWALTINAYNYDIAFKPRQPAWKYRYTKYCRFPLPGQPTSIFLPQETVLIMENLQMSPITATQIKSWIGHDPILSKVQDEVLQGWVDTRDPVYHLINIIK